jgi:hypothetical protein
MLQLLSDNETSEEMLNANSCIVLIVLPACRKFRSFNNNNSEKAFVGINSMKLLAKESAFSLGRQRIWLSSLIRLLSKDKCSKFGK